MIDVGSNYKLVNDLLSKNNGMYVTPDQYNRFAELAVNQYFTSITGKKVGTRSAYGLNRTLDRRLNDLKEEEFLTLTGGVVSIPDSVEIITALITQDFIPIRSTDEDRIARVMQDPLSEPTDDDPVFIESNGVLNVYPTNIPTVEIRYLRKPNSPLYGYTVVNGRAVYDESTSVHIDFPKTCEGEITMRILQYLGLTMGSGDITNFAMSKQGEE